MKREMFRNFGVKFVKTDKETNVVLIVWEWPVSIFSVFIITPKVCSCQHIFLHCFFSVRSKQVLWFWIVQDIRYYIVQMCVLDLFAVSYHVILSRGNVIVFIINSMFPIHISSLIPCVDFSKYVRQ